MEFDFICWKFIMFMRPNDNFHPYQLNRLPAFQVHKPHNCPHCNCGSSVQVCQQVISRPMSPVYNGISQFRNQVSQGHEINNNVSITKVLPRRMEIKQAISPANIYYKRTDRCGSNVSIDSSRSISREAKIRDVAISPTKSTTRVNIRYLSPQISTSQWPSNYQWQNRNQFVVQKPKEKEPVRESQEEPKVPSILKRKSSTSKKKSYDLMSAASSKKDEIRQDNKDLGTMSAIMSRKAIKSSNLPVTNEYISKGQWQRSACDILLEQEQDRLIASEISRDLKLNYDYFQTQDISKLSENAK